MGQGSGPAHRLSQGQRFELQQRVRSGVTHAAAALAVGCSAKSVQRLLEKTGGVKPRTRPQSALRLSLPEREEISRSLLAGDSCRAIATRLGRSPSTVSRDVAAGGARLQYRAWRAEAKAHRRARRPKTSKLAACPRLRAEVERSLARRWSPQQIAARLVRDFPDDPEMRVSHETIYQSLFVQGRGALRKELTRCLRSGRAQRRPHGRALGAGQLKDMVLISDRPANVEDRAVPGHWEGDLILGKQSRSAIATLVERQTRFVMLVDLRTGRLAADVKIALIRAIQELPAHLRRSLTWDQGKEMGEHVPFTVATGVQVYFCDPRSPWQRATSENTNGLLRQYFPKGTDLSGYTQAQLDAVAAELNGRPRQTLDWQTPSEA
ncbi:MAG: IS30 family transposase, partial [Gemmatimonadaceae bacterium]